MAIFRELQRRKVIRVAGVYLVIAWLLLQVAATVAPILGLPGWFEKLVLVLLGIGFPVALILAWALELSPDGLRSDSGRSSGTAGSFVDYAILVAIFAGGSFLLADRFAERPAAPAITPDASVAVLPFENLNADEANGPFAAGIHSDLLAQLSRIEALRTVSRTSMNKYRDTVLSIPEIAAELGVATVLEGGVQRSGDSVRINVQLINAAVDEPLWSQVFDRELTAANIFEIQSEIALAIAHQLSATLSPAERQMLDIVPTESFEALEAYFIGKQLLESRTRESISAAVEYFEKVVEIDPEFALGWSGIADAYMLLPEYDYDADMIAAAERTREAVKRALALDPTLPEVRASDAFYQLRFYDWKGVEKIFREAIASAPDNTNALHWLSHTLAWQGQFNEALEIAQRAIDSEPDSLFMRTNLAYILIDAGCFDEGLGLAWEIWNSAPHHIVQRRNIFLHELRAGRARAGAEAFVNYTELTGGDADTARVIGDMFVAWQETGVSGSLTPAMIRRAKISRELLGQVLAFVGDADGAIAELQAAAEANLGLRSVYSMKINPAYDFIRDDPRFVELLEKVGLAVEAVAPEAAPTC